MDKELIKRFYDKYTSRRETRFRLPSSCSIDDFWKEELEYRRQNGVELPLKSCDGTNYFFVRTDNFLASQDVICCAALDTFGMNCSSGTDNDRMIEEAYYSSSIEGANSTADKARELILTGRKPHNMDERMIVNNYRALQYMLNNLDNPISEELIINIGEILTEGLADSTEVSDYRDDIVYVTSHTGEIVYTAPDASQVRPMMNQLISYINDSSIHPIERAVIAHIYFVTIHPFFDGNGRTARAITYMILLQAGYDFFRLVPISGILSDERSEYYRSIQKCQNPENGMDLTYFANYYTKLLARTVDVINNKLAIRSSYESLKSAIDGSTSQGARQLAGAYWLMENSIESITSDKWKRKFKVSFETARQDLKSLESCGFLVQTKNGRKVVFRVE